MFKKFIATILIYLFLQPVVAYAGRVFDGTDDCIDYGSSLTLRPLNDLSVDFWVKMDSGVQTGDLVIERGESDSPETEAGNTNLYLDIRGNSGSRDFRYIHEYSSGSNELHQFNANVPNDTWHFIALTRDDTAQTVILWEAAPGSSLTLVDTFNYTNSGTGGTSAAAKLTVGTRSDCTDRDFTGSVAEVRYYSRTLTVEEHEQNMRGLTVYGNLLLYSPIYGITSPEADFSGNALNGTVTGATATDHPPVGPMVLP